jgi:hypothetical protein
MLRRGNFEIGHDLASRRTIAWISQLVFVKGLGNVVVGTAADR